jgi:DNA replication and repair protein RecF
VRPAVGVFMPERLELVKGAPAARRDHFDRVIAGVWPARADARLAYSRALAQRNALLGRIRAGLARADSLPPWDAELARHGTELIANRSAAVELLAEPFRRHARELGLSEETELSYRPRSHATEAAQLAAELAERREADLERGFTSHGPHRDDVRLLHDERSLRVYGSQGQQRTAVLALLLAERDLLLERTGQAPLMLLDDVMSELDADRRERLATTLRAGGQAIVTATDPNQVPGSGEPGVVLVAVDAGSVRCDPVPRAGAERTLAA